METANMPFKQKKLGRKHIKSFANRNSQSGNPFDFCFPILYFRI